jgi:ABC-2 type transport system ATP-binding protein
MSSHILAHDGAVAALSGLGIRSLLSHPPTLEQLLLRDYGDDLARMSNTASEVAR